MRARIVNTMPMPFDIETTAGKVFLPANGEIEADFDPAYLDLLRLSAVVRVHDAPADAPPVKRKRGRPRKGD